MKVRSSLRLFLAAILIVAVFSSSALAATSNREVRPTVSLTYDIEPAAFMPGDTGIITVTLQNMATDRVYITEDAETLSMNAYIASATLGGNSNFEVLDSSHTNVGLLGPQDTIKLSFNVRAKNTASAGTHFLNLQLVGGSNMYNLNYRIPVKVDDRDLQIILPNMPSTIMNEVSTINVEVVNRRPNAVTSVIVTPEAEGMVFTPSEYFIGSIPAGNKSTATFTLNTMHSNPGKRDVSFAVSYFNGDNLRQTSKLTRQVDLIGQHSLIFTSLDVSRAGNRYAISGDLNNFGTTDAKNVMISVADSDNIMPVQPYARYYIGTLETDDFSSFELSAQAMSGGVSSIPVIIEFRDPNNAYISIRENISVSTNSIASASAAPGEEKDSPVMLWAIAGILAIGITALIYNSWKKRRNDESSVLRSEDEEEDEDEELLEN
jgi:cbb3-type cytochrome oxidase subunit 3